jgi:hypothetical protein
MEGVSKTDVSAFEEPGACGADRQECLSYIETSGEN